MSTHEKCDTFCDTCDTCDTCSHVTHVVMTHVVMKNVTHFSLALPHAIFLNIVIFKNIACGSAREKCVTFFI